MKTKLTLQPPKGFRDFYPEDFAVQQWLFSQMKEVSNLFGYVQYDGPLVETIELYAAKSSEELVKEQTFQITDRGGRTLALRPEMTPSLARMIAAKQQELGSPLRWFNIGPRFRYEAPQRGRTRQFTQWDADLIGPTTPEADAEIIALVATFFKKLGFSEQEVVIKVNNRRLMEFKASLLDFPKERIGELFQMIDKKDKMSEQKWLEYIQKQGLSGKQAENLQSILSDRDAAFESEELTQMFSTLKDMGLDKYVEFDPSIVRGLDYYTGTVFEARDRKGDFRAIVGGGRYDNLIELFGGTPLSGIGFACGDMVLLEMLKEYGKIPKDIPLSNTEILVTLFSSEQTRASIEIATLLRANNISTELFSDSTVKLEKQLKYADRKKIPYATIIGPDEEKKGQVVIKNLESRTQEVVSFSKLIAYFSSLK